MRRCPADRTSATNAAFSTSPPGRASSPVSLFTSHPMTFAPRRRVGRTVARPMPLPAPVTIARGTCVPFSIHDALPRSRRASTPRPTIGRAGRTSRARYPGRRRARRGLGVGASSQEPSAATPSSHERRGRPPEGIAVELRIAMCESPRRSARCSSPATVTSGSAAHASRPPGSNSRRSSPPVAAGTGGDARRPRAVSLRESTPSLEPRRVARQRTDRVAERPPHVTEGLAINNAVSSSLSATCL